MTRIEVIHKWMDRFDRKPKSRGAVRLSQKEQGELLKDIKTITIKPTGFLTEYDLGLR